MSWTSRHHALDLYKEEPRLDVRPLKKYFEEVVG